MDHPGAAAAAATAAMESQACGGSTAMSSAPSSPVSYTPPSPTSDSTHEPILKAQQAAQQSLSAAVQRSPCFPALSLLYGTQVPSSYLFVGSSPFLPHLPNPDPTAFMNRNLMFGAHQGSAFTDLLVKEKERCLDFARNYQRAKSSLEVIQQQHQQQQQQAAQQQSRLGLGSGQNWRSPLELLKVEDNLTQTPDSEKASQGAAEPPRWDNLFRLFNPSMQFRKLSSPSQIPMCPICGITLTSQQLPEHFEFEMEKLSNDRRWMTQTERTQEDDMTDQHLERMCRPPYGAEKRSPLSRWETYVKVRGNRQHRLNAKVRKDEENNPWDRHYAFSLAARKRRTEEITSSPLDLKQEPGTVVGSQDTKRHHVDGGASSPSDARPSSADRQSHSPKSPPTGSDAAGHCSVCEKPYDKPHVSMSCWHVHCEACWNQSLATKQCCPQCEVATSSQELRPIKI